jgi:outer membrane protein assembly factor BamD (BamD/ComL family)
LLDDFIESFPRSPFADSAMYYRTEAYEKLALKEFNNAVFYVNAKEPESAVVYYKTFMTQFVNSRLVDQARFNSIELLLKLNRTSEALDLQDELLTKGKNKALQKAARVLTGKIKRTADGGK